MERKKIDNPGGFYLEAHRSKNVITFKWFSRTGKLQTLKNRICDTPYEAHDVLQEYIKAFPDAMPGVDLKVYEDFTK